MELYALLPLLAGSGLPSSNATDEAFKAARRGWTGISTLCLLHDPFFHAPLIRFVAPRLELLKLPQLSVKPVVR